MVLEALEPPYNTFRYLNQLEYTRGDPKVTGIGLRRGERVGKLSVRPGVC